MAAEGIVLERSLPGRAYYEATGAVTFGGDSSEPWTVLDGTLCFEDKVGTATADLPGEFSLIVEQDGGGQLRTVGGTFVVSLDAIGGSDDLDIQDDAIALDLR